MTLKESWRLNLTVIWKCQIGQFSSPATALARVDGLKSIGEREAIFPALGKL